MKIVITGASGKVAGLLIPLLRDQGHQLLLVGRDTSRMPTVGTGITICNYQSFPQIAKDYDILVHLAVLNNDVSADIRSFRQVNVSLTMEIAEIAKHIGIKRFMFVSSIHALDQQNNSPYALSKREAVECLLRSNIDNIEIIYLPFVYGDIFRGKLSILNRFPRLFSKTLFSVLTSVKPSVHISKLASEVSRRELKIGSELIITDLQTENRIFKFIKRLTDISFALSVLVLLWWLIALIWIAICLDSPGGAIFAQKRVGKNCKIFTCYKFRSMKKDTVETGTHDVPVSAVTNLGGFLRRTKLDELPQVWNILRNEMSLVGPRPGLPVQVELQQERLKLGIFNALPGITGLAQINGVDMSDPVRLALEDQKYIALQCLILEVKIIIKTFLGQGSGDRIKNKK